jgi:hypothetical protein
LDGKRRQVTAWHNVANAYVLAAKGRQVNPLKLTRSRGLN